MGGGAERMLHQLVNELKKSYKISIIEKTSSIYKFEPDPDVNILKPLSNLDIINENRKLVIRLHRLFIRRLISLAMYICPRIIHRKYITNSNYDFEISFNYLYVSYLVANSTNRTSKKIMWIHGDIYDLQYWKYRNPLLRLKFLFYYHLQKRAFSKANKIVAISKNTRDSIIKLYPEVESITELVYNGYNFLEINKKSEEYLSKPRKHSLRFITIGRLEVNKNHKLMLQSLKLLKNKGYDFELIVIGNGGLLNQLQETVKSLELENNIEFYGYVTNPYPVIKSSDIFLSTSLSEGFPTVIVESLFFGVPVVTTPVGGAEELIKTGINGIISGFSAESFCESIIKIISSKLDKVGIQKTISNLAIENWIKNIEERILIS